VTGVAKPSFNQSQTVSSWHTIAPIQVDDASTVLVPMRADVVSDSAVLVLNSPRIGPVPTTQRS
jgi:hypothetical protein